MIRRLHKNEQNLENRGCVENGCVTSDVRTVLGFVHVTLLGTRQFIDKTTHRHGFWRQFIDIIEDNSSTLFEDNSSTHYYLAIIPKLIK